MTRKGSSLVAGLFVFATTLLAQDGFVPFKARYIERIVARDGTNRVYREIVILRNSEGSMYRRTTELDPTTKKVIRSFVQIDSRRDSTSYLVEEEENIVRTSPLFQPADPKVVAAIIERRKQSNLPTLTFLGRQCYIVPLIRGNTQYGGEVWQDAETGFYLYKEGGLPNLEKEVTEAVEFVVEEAEPSYFEQPDLSGYQVNP